jgi:hypothetical protein
VFANLRGATIGFVMSFRPPARPSVRVKQLGFHWTDFHEISCLSLLRKSVEKIPVALKYDKNNGYFTRRPMHIVTVTR